MPCLKPNIIHKNCLNATMITRPCNHVNRLLRMGTNTYSEASRHCAYKMSWLNLEIKWHEFWRLIHVLGIKLGHCPKLTGNSRVCIPSLVQGSGQIILRLAQLYQSLLLLEFLEGPAAPDLSQSAQTSPSELTYSPISLYVSKRYIIIAGLTHVFKLRPRTGLDLGAVSISSSQGLPIFSYLVLSLSFRLLVLAGIPTVKQDQCKQTLNLTRPKC
ncbi:hypothetical protein VNO77_03245 [Canavalia gladiata]|uniref:Uncharacterized protein n=1 Tax=Canavalia gladiata TaxID=3824 RepID=A0AAN9MZB8_CANGL